MAAQASYIERLGGAAWQAGSRPARGRPAVVRQWLVETAGGLPRENGIVETRRACTSSGLAFAGEYAQAAGRGGACANGRVGRWRENVSANQTA